MNPCFSKAESHAFFHYVHYLSDSVASLPNVAFLI